MAKKRAMLTPMNPPLAGTDATVLLSLAGLNNLARVKLEIHEGAFEHEGSGASDKTIGTMTGAALSFNDGVKRGMTIVLDASGGVMGDVPQPDADAKDRKRVIAFIIPKGSDSKQYDWKFFAVPDDVTQENGDPVHKRRNWFFYVKMTEPDTTESNRVQMAVIPHALGVGAQSTYDWHAGNQIKLYAHGAVKPPAGSGHSSFEDLSAAIAAAKKFIFISDWSFHSYFRVKRDGSPLNLQTTGRLLLDAANRGVLVGILAWQHQGSDTFGLGYPLDEQNNAAPARLLALNGGKPLPDNLLWRCAYRSMSYSHHQKFVALDCEVSGKKMVKAFFGGLDLTKGRWDWDEHVILPGDKDGADFRRDQYAPTKGGDGIYYDDWYSNEFQSDTPRTVPLARVVEGDDHSAGSFTTMPREPWHDIYGSVVGPTAWDFLREWIGRWDCPNSDDKGDPALTSFLHNPTPKTKKVHDLYDALRKDKDFVQQHEPVPGSGDDFPWSAQLVRSITADAWSSKLYTSNDDYIQWLERYQADFKWVLPGDFERSIQDAYLNAIGLAEEYVYIETQYFISSGDKWTTKDSNKIRNGLADALCSRIEKKKGKNFHVYVVTPMYPEGAPDGGTGAAQTQRFYEWQTIKYMIERLGPDWHKYLSFFFPARNGLPQGGPTGYPPKGQLAKMSDIMFVDNEGKATVGDPNVDHLIAADTQERPLPRRQRIQLNNRYMVYVHSKFMLIDDTYAILGSANLNERSLAGNRDTEVCVQMWPKYPGYVDACKTEIKEIRNHLFKEHFGATTDDPKTFAKTAQAAGKRNYESYARGIPIDPSSSGLCLSLPLVLVNGSLGLQPLTGVAETSSEYLFDAASNEELWKWSSDKGGLAAHVGDSPE